MESKELRQFVLAKIAEKQGDFNVLVKSVKDFCIGILVDCKVVITELDTVKKIGDLAIDEIDDRTNTGIFDPIDAPVAKGLLSKLLATPWGIAIELWYTNARNEALAKIAENTSEK